MPSIKKLVVEFGGVKVKQVGLESDTAIEITEDEARRLESYLNSIPEFEPITVQRTSNGDVDIVFRNPIIQTQIPEAVMHIKSVFVS